MRDEDKTKGRLIEELAEMRKRISEMEATQARLVGIEKALRESEEQFRLLYENAPLGYQSLDENGHFLGVNQAWLDTLGYKREEVIGRWFGDFLAPGYQDHFKINFPKFKAAGEIHWVEFEMLRKDGSQIPVAFDGQIGRDEQGRFRQTHCILHDISEIKRSQDALKESEQRFRAVIDNVEVGISVLNANMEIVEVNKAMKRYFPHVRPGCGQICYEHYNDPPRLKPCSYCPCVLTLQDGEVHDAITETPAGSEIRCYHLISSPIKDSEGRVQYVIELTEDITDRKRAEEALRLSEERYRRLFEDAPLMYVITRNERGVPLISDCNELFLNSVGYTRKAVLGQPLADFYSPESRTELLERGGYTRALAGEFFIGERQLLTHDGRLIPALLYTATEMDPSGQVIGTRAMFVDITGRKKAEGKMQDSEERLRLTLEAAQIGIWDWDVKNDQWYASPTYHSMLGYEPETGLADRRKWLDRVHPDDRAQVKERIQEVLTRDFKEYQYEARLQHADGTYRWQQVRGFGIKRDENGKVTRMLGIRMDITERKQAEEARRESDKRYRTLFEESRDGVYFVLRDGEIMDVNPSFLEIFGYTREELIGKDIRALYVDPADRLKFQEEIEKKGFVKDYAVKYRKRDGAEMDCLLTSSVYHREDGSIAGYRGIVRDVTDQKKLQRELLQAQKMESIGTLAGGIAHDFNNLLTVVLGFSELLLIGKDQRDPSYADLQRIKHAATSGADLVKRILAFSRKADFNPRPLNLNHEIEQAKQLLTRTVPKMIEVELALSNGLPPVIADPTQVEQVLMNLAVNARDAMPDGGKLTIVTRLVALDEEYCGLHLGAKPGNYVMLSVSDTGHGMDQETLNHIFEPFYTTKASGEGTGLGLAMVYGMVKQHGGYIICNSEPGMGTTFNIYLPVIPNEAKSENATETRILSRGTETILLVDDEEMVRDLGKRILERSGYAVLTAANGLETLDEYKKEGHNISLVILDLMMPEMGGKQCLEDLLKIDPQIKVLIASGYSAAGETKKAIELGASGFVDKPYAMKGLLEAVRRVLDA
ncbi:MAG: PAS domain S-box protein [Desulfomonile tiedjei]|nr:PAS domain S-box protein [Desulfomonile tiedjei]